VVAVLLVVLVVLAAGCAGDASSEPTTEPLRSYTVGLRTDDSADRYRYVAEDPVDLRVGDEVTFEVVNTGTLIHDLRVVAPDGTPIGAAPAARPGATTSVTVLFTEPGYYRLDCLVDDHLTTHRMQSIVEVTEA
jgi:plastocyanin